jgi:hypothetical protein
MHDVENGKEVLLTQPDYENKKYSDDNLDVE